MNQTTVRRVTCRLILGLFVSVVICVLVGILSVFIRDGRWFPFAPSAPIRASRIDWMSVAMQIGLETFTAFWFLAIGGCLGSFLNVVAYRLPRKQTLLGHSQCPHCRSAIRARDNIPVLGWIARRGRCFRCWLPIHPRYPIVELAFAFAVLVAAIAVFPCQGATVTGQFSFHRFGFSRTLLECDGTLLARFADTLVWYFVLTAAVLMERAGQRIHAGMITFAILITLVTKWLEPTSSPLSWIHWRETSSPGPITARDALQYGLLGALIGLAVHSVWEGVMAARLRDETGRLGRLLISSYVGLVFGWQAACVLFALAFVTTWIPFQRGRPKSDHAHTTAGRMLIAGTAILLLWAAGIHAFS